VRTVHPGIRKITNFCIICMRPEMKSIATNHMPEVVTDKPYDFKRCFNRSQKGYVGLASALNQ
jgi:hypothetical protein